MNLVLGGINANEQIRLVRYFFDSDFSSSQEHSEPISCDSVHFDSSAPKTIHVQWGDLPECSSEDECHSDWEEADNDDDEEEGGKVSLEVIGSKDASSRSCIPPPLNFVGDCK